MMEIDKNTYLRGFGVAVVVLALVRCAFPGVAGQGASSVAEQPDSVADSTTVVAAAPIEKPTTDSLQPTAADLRPHRIYGVQSFKDAFPDNNDVQLVAAKRWGVPPVKNRADAESRKRELVYIGSNPYYHVNPLGASIPYLVPHAALLLQDIGQTFFDSLEVKGIPLHRIIVTSVLRSQEDVVRLRRYNANATEQSCHLYGTTFDIAYNKYKTVSDPDGPERREVRNDTLKYVLCEVLDDMRQRGRCYVKYEVKQGCFHMTVR